MVDVGSLGGSAEAPKSRAIVKRMAKRTFDLVISNVLLVALVPLLLGLACLIYATLGRPILLQQVRCGEHGRPFLLYKFRSMTDERDASGELLDDQLRLTRVGRFIRRLSFDELPQLVNVIKGDMSLVGPRPLLMEYLPLYSLDQARRHEVKPGITGWAQVSGRNAISWELKLSLDVWYVDHRSLWLDCYVLLLTLLKVLRREGISQLGHATADRFRGSG
jgi:sugar transferase EpsL